MAVRCYTLSMGRSAECRAGLPVSKAPDSDEDEDAPVVVGEDGVEEFAVDDFRTQFPMAFGEQAQSLDVTYHNTLLCREASDKVRIAFTLPMP
jgi:hypothetical protein